MNHSQHIFKQIEEISAINFSETVLWIINANQIPPHIGISSNNYYFSLKANGKDEMLPTEKLLDLITRKNIPTLFLQLNTKIDVEIITQHFFYYSKAIAHTVTCLHPIKTILNTPNATKIIDVLIAKENEISKIAGLNLPSSFEKLPTYSLEDIHLHIQQIQQ